MKLLYFYIIFGLTITNSFGQTTQKCKVINEELIGTYIGECLNGLANGMGELTFSKGKFVFQGNFKDGKLQGEGQIFSIDKNKRKLVTKGYWEDNVYVGDKSVPYQVKRKVNLDRYAVKKTSENDNKVMINFYQNGVRNNVSNLNVTVNNGNRIVGNYTEGYENIIFPFTCQVYYTTSSKFKASSYDVNFEVVINEPGSWEIFLYN